MQSGISSSTYLTRSLLNKIFKKKLSNDDINELILSGKIAKHFSYYKPTESLLRQLGAIPNSITMSEHCFNEVAKRKIFVLKEIADLFNVNIDTAKKISEKYFYKKHNYWYKNDNLINHLNEGIEELRI